jgi:hypothetical protein
MSLIFIVGDLHGQLGQPDERGARVAGERRNRRRQARLLFSTQTGGSVLHSHCDRDDMSSVLQLDLFDDWPNFAQSAAAPIVPARLTVSRQTGRESQP